MKLDIQTVKNRYDIVGNDPRLMLAINKAMQVSGTDLSILVVGESGVGKDVFSRIIHDLSSRKHRRLVSVNCGAIPEGTIESELFGHLKGSFTGADKDRKGIFEEADGGTIFLDEVGELPLATQVKLLRVLENGEIIPVGSSVARKVDVRVVAATNVDILAAIRDGHFREDLYYRLNQISIVVPPLRERKEDIPKLFLKFATDVAERYQMPPIKLTDDARDYLVNYPWYGNVRELRNITEQIAVVETERTISRAILQNYLNYVPEETMPAVVHSGAKQETVTDRELLLKALTMGQMINEMREEINSLRQAITTLAQGLPLEQQVRQTPYEERTLIDHSAADLQGIYDRTHRMHELSAQQPMGEESETQDFNDAEVVEDESLLLRDRERNAILKALERHKGKRKLAAKELGISERTLYRKLKDYDIE